MNIRTQRQSGATLIEVLVSVIVLAVGIVGMSALQATSLQNSTRSVLRTQAAYLSYEILDRIRANPSQIYSVDLAAELVAGDCISASCSGSELMQFDLLEWKCGFSQYAGNAICASLALINGTSYLPDTILPGGDGSVSCLAVTAGKQCTVVIRWREERSNASDAAQENFTLNILL